MDLYIVCAVWQSTKDNHAGMYYLAKQIEEKYKLGKVHLIAIPTRQLGPLNFVYRIYNLYVAFSLLFKVKKEDVVFLMEYFLPMCEQSIIAKMLSRRASIIGIAHSIPKTIDRLYGVRNLRRKANYLDCLLVLGSSLKKHLINRGISEEKIIATYHYVDNKYYGTQRKKVEVDKPLTVVCMGNMQRDYGKLAEIVSKTPGIRYIICKGRASLDALFSRFSNVSLLGYVSEAELKKIMHSSDVSLNLMKDTVGSNVITTSLASGLAMVCSDVGSIRDYIPNDTGYFFKDVNQAVDILNKLRTNQEMLHEAQQHSLSNARRIELDNFLNWFFSFLQKKQL